MHFAFVQSISYSVHATMWISKKKKNFTIKLNSNTYKYIKIKTAHTPDVRRGGGAGPQWPAISVKLYLGIQDTVSDMIKERK